MNNQMTMRDIMFPITKHISRFFMLLKSDWYDRYAVVERNKAKQAFAAASFLESAGDIKRAAIETKHAQQSIADAQWFEKRAMLIRADLRKYK